MLIDEFQNLWQLCRKKVNVKKQINYQAPVSFKLMLPIFAIPEGGYGGLINTFREVGVFCSIRLPYAPLITEGDYLTYSLKK